MKTAIGRTAKNDKTSMTETYQPRYSWRRTQLDENDPPSDLDWCGLDGDGYIGHIRKDTNGPLKAAGNGRPRSPEVTVGQSYHPWWIEDRPTLDRGKTIRRLGTLCADQGKAL